MKVISKIIIEKPVQEVWDYFDNPNNMTKWLSGLQSFEHLSGVQGEVGAKARHTYENNGKTIELIEEITSRVPMKELKGTLTHQMMESTMDNQFEDLGEGRTMLTATVHTRFKSLVAKILSPFMKRGFRQRQNEDLKRLKRLVEAQ